VDREQPAFINIETGKDVLYRAGEITSSTLQASELESADVIIRPQVGDLHWMDFSRIDDLVKMGEKSARESLKEIQASLPIYRRITHLAGRFIKIRKN